MNLKTKPIEVSARRIWIFLWAFEHRGVRYVDVKRELGISRRTYNRDLQILREAGVLLDRHAAKQPFLAYVTFDTLLAPIVGAVRATMTARRRAAA